jgi:DNA repair protein RadC
MMPSGGAERSTPVLAAAEMPRERLMAYGAGSLADVEILALVLRDGSKGHPALSLAREILSRFGPLADLAPRTVQELRSIRGIGDAKALGVVAAFELGRRASAGRPHDRPVIKSPADVARLFQPVIRDLKKEVFRVLLLDSAHHLLRDVVISVGILNSTVVHPREVFQPAITEPAAAVILVHNHPSGNADPSAEDIQVTGQMTEAGKILGIPVHDHIILTGGGFSSLAQRGLL